MSRSTSELQDVSIHFARVLFAKLLRVTDPRSGVSLAPTCEALPKLVYFGGDEMFARKSMKPIQGYHLIKPEDLSWRPSNLMRIPNADYLERTGSENMGARLWRLPPKSANTLHKHIRAEEFYFVLEGTGRMRVGDEALTVPHYGGVLVGPDQLRLNPFDRAAGKPVRG